MSCDAGVCTAAAKKAVLNVGDLQAMLASSDITVKTGSVTENIDIDRPLSWASTSRLTLDAHQFVIVKRPVTVTGAGSLTLIDNDGGTAGDLLFLGKAAIECRIPIVLSPSTETATHWSTMLPRSRMQ